MKITFDDRELIIASDNWLRDNEDDYVDDYQSMQTKENFLNVYLEYIINEYTDVPQTYTMDYYNITEEQKSLIYDNVKNNLSKEFKRRNSIDSFRTKLEETAMQLANEYDIIFDVNFFNDNDIEDYIKIKENKQMSIE